MCTRARTRTRAHTYSYRKQAGDSALESLSANGLSVPLFVCTDRLLRQRCVRAFPIQCPSAAIDLGAVRRRAVLVLTAQRGAAGHRTRACGCCHCARRAGAMSETSRASACACYATPTPRRRWRTLSCESAAFFATRTAVAAGACMRAPRGHVQDGGSAPPLKRSLSDGGACGRSASALRTARRSIALR